MAKIVVRLPEPKKEYSEDNQRQINRALSRLIVGAPYDSMQTVLYNLQNNLPLVKTMVIMRMGLVVLLFSYRTAGMEMK